ncbi:MAG: hypothetical protein Q9198_009040, partial [Flavoplaca austrocitrina]
MDKAPSSITQWADKKSGAFNRAPSKFRNWISRKPDAEFPPEKGRYHLYVSYACPWAHRTLIVRKLKGLEDIIPYTAVHWEMLEKGWRFATPDDNVPGDNVTPDPIHGFAHLRDIYFKINPDYEGRFTVPTLYDIKQGKIVSNESSEIIRMFYTEFDDILPEKYQKVDLFPKHLQKDIEATNEWTYNDINNGVYKTGFAQYAQPPFPLFLIPSHLNYNHHPIITHPPYPRTQSAYETAIQPLFTSLSRAESHLASQFSSGPYYFGRDLTEADIRLYTTIIRFDPVYVQHFKCNIRDIRSGYPALH